MKMQYALLIVIGGSLIMGTVCSITNIPIWISYLSSFALAIFMADITEIKTKN